MAVTAKRDGMRLLAIVLGEENGKVRNQETGELLDYGFRLYELERIKKKGEILGTTTIDKANIKEINLIATRDVTVLKKKGEDTKTYKSDLKISNLRLPINSGEEIGRLYVLDNLGNKIDDVSVTVLEDIKKDTFWNILKKVILNVIKGEFV